MHTKERGSRKRCSAEDIVELRTCFTRSKVQRAVVDVSVKHLGEKLVCVCRNLALDRSSVEHLACRVRLKHLSALQSRSCLSFISKSGAVCKMSNVTETFLFLGKIKRSAVEHFSFAEWTPACPIFFTSVVWWKPRETLFAKICCLASRLNSLHSHNAGGVSMPVGLQRLEKLLKQMATRHHAHESRFLAIPMLPGMPNVIT